MRYRRMLRFLVLAIIVLAGTAPVRASAAGPYTLKVIGPFSPVGGTGTFGLNDRGHVTGEGAGSNLFLYDGVLHTLGKPSGAKWAEGRDISNGDVMAVTAQGKTGRHGYAVTYGQGRGTWLPLATPRGYTHSQASAILPDSSAIAGTICTSRDTVCRAQSNPPARAAVWLRSGGRYGLPVTLPVGKSSLESRAVGIARAANVIAVVGEVYPRSPGAGTVAGAVVWTLHGLGFLRLSAPPAFPYAAAFNIAHGPGGTFYIAGQAGQPNTSVTEGLLWTIACGAAGCHEKGRQTLTTFGQVFAVNAHKVAVGYSRPNGDGAGFDFVWQDGVMTTIPLTPFAINASGEIAGGRVNPSTFRREVSLLQPVTPGN